MTISTEICTAGPFYGNGVTTVFPYGFKIVSASHLRVVLIDSFGQASDLSLDDGDYSVTGVGSDAGGTVVKATPLHTGHRLTIVRKPPLTQETDLASQGPYYAEVVEARFDFLMMQIQAVAEAVDRAMKSEPGQPLPSFELVAAAADFAAAAQQAATDALTEANEAAARAEEFASQLNPLLPATSALARLRTSAAKQDAFWVGSNQAVEGSSAISGGVSGVGTGRTYVMKNDANGCRQDGYIRKVTLTIPVNNNIAGAGFKLKILRPNGTSYDVIAETAMILVGALTGQQTFVLPEPLGPLQVKDHLGFYLTGHTSTSFTVAVNSGKTGWILRNTLTDAPSGAVWTDNADFVLPLWGTGSAPMVAAVGDSIVEGHPNYHSHLHTGPLGDRNNDIMYHVRNLIPNFDYQNWGLGSAIWSQVLTNLASAVSLAKPKAFIFYCGVNDIVQNRTWSQVATDIYSCLALIPDGAPVFLSEMLPYSGTGSATDAVAAKIRDWNQRYAALAAINGITMIPIWDQMGVVRPSTGFKDDLNPAYNYGDGHLNTAGAMKVAELWSQGILKGVA